MPCNDRVLVSLIAFGLLCTLVLVYITNLVSNPCILNIQDSPSSSECNNLFSFGISSSTFLLIVLVCQSYYYRENEQTGRAMTIALTSLSLIAVGVALFSTGSLQIGLNKTCSQAQLKGATCQEMLDSGVNINGDNIKRNWTIIQSGIGISGLGCIIIGVITGIYSSRVMRIERVNKSLIDINGSGKNGAARIEYDAGKDSRKGPAPMAEIPPILPAVNQIRNDYVEPQIEVFTTIGRGNNEHIPPSKSRSNNSLRHEYYSRSNSSKYSKPPYYNQHRNDQPLLSSKRYHSNDNLRDPPDHYHNQNYRYNSSSNVHNYGGYHQDASHNISIRQGNYY